MHVKFGLTQQRGQRMREERTNSQILRQAADLMEKRGYNDHTRIAADGSVCVLGALDIVLGRTVNEHTPIAVLIVQKLELKPYCPSLDEVTPGNRYIQTQPDCVLANWSNTVGKQVVIDGLRKVADLIE